MDFWDKDNLKYALEKTAVVFNSLQPIAIKIYKNRQKELEKIKNQIKLEMRKSYKKSRYYNSQNKLKRDYQDKIVDEILK
jgi:subtilase family serine protease